MEAERGEGVEGFGKVTVRGEGFDGVYEGVKGMVGNGRNAGALFFFLIYWGFRCLWSWRARAGEC